MQECNPAEEYPAGDSSVPMSAGGRPQRRSRHFTPPHRGDRFPIP